MPSLTIYSFARLNKEEKVLLVNERGVFLENLGDAGNELNLYYLEGFFVEVEINRLQDVVVDIVPYKQGGYKTARYKEKLGLN